MIDFPVSPSVGTIHASGAVAWQWDGEKWLATTSTVFLLRKLATNPSAGPGAGTAILYAVQGAGTSATLRVQAGTSATPADLLVNIGSGF